eukprot:1159945-Pelagomonas_calceolata.AAC.2
MNAAQVAHGEGHASVAPTRGGSLVMLRVAAALELCRGGLQANIRDSGRHGEMAALSLVEWLVLVFACSWN